MLLFLYYCLKVIICSGVLYGYYWLALRNSRFHQWNRWYLLASVVLSFGLPLLQIPLLYYPEEPTAITYSVQLLATPDIYFAKQKPQPFRLTSSFIAFACYLLIVLGLLFFFFRNLRAIQLLKRKYSSQTVDGIHFYNTSEAGTPFSFFRNIFWNDSIDPQSEKGRQMLLHEMAHITEHHSVDKIFVQLSLVFAFWNPVLYFIKKELSIIHEFIADQRAAAGNDRLQYASLLLMKAMGSEQFALGNPFFHSQLKRRLVMLTTSKNPRFSYIRRLLVLPLAALSLVLFSFKYNEIKDKQKTILQTQSTSTEEEFYGDTIKPKFYVQLSEMYKGSAIESIMPTTDMSGAIVKTVDDKTYFLNRTTAEKELNFIIMDSGFIAPPGAVLVTGKDKFVVRNGAFIQPSAYSNFPQYPYTIDTTAFGLSKATGSYTNRALEVSTNKKLNSGDWALVIVDGKRLSQAELKELDVKGPTIIDVGKSRKFMTKYWDNNKLHTELILEREEATARYGEAGKNGARIITTYPMPDDPSLFIVDGIEVNKEYVATIDPGDVQSLKLLKGDNTAVAKYGEKARGGVLLFVTKKFTTSGALIMIDGLPSTEQAMNQLAPERIGSVNVLKGAAATAKYGEKGKNGAIEVTTKIARNEVTFDSEPAQKLKDTVVIGYRKQPVTVGASASTQASAPILNEVVAVGHPAQNERYEMVFTKVEEPATFPGGQDGWNRYLLRNLQYPDAARKAQTQGTVRVQIIVNENGNITELKALNNPGNGLAEEAVRLLAKGPKWNPAKQNGRAVTYRFIQPVVFTLP